MVCFLSSDPKGILGKLNDPVRIVAPLDGDTGGLKKRVNNGRTRLTNACTEIKKNNNIYNLDLKYTYYANFPLMNSTVLYFILYVRVYNFFFCYNLFHFNNDTHYVRLAKI